MQEENAWQLFAHGLCMIVSCMHMVAVVEQHQACCWRVQACSFTACCLRTSQLCYAEACALRARDARRQTHLNAEVGLDKNK